MGKFIFGVIVGFVVVFAVVYLYFSTGTAPVAVSAPAMPFEKMFARMAQHARIDKEAPKTAPIAADEAAYTAGAQIYKDNCAVCHGLPGQEPTAIAKGMYPKPPKLTEGTGVTDDPAGETYWKVSGGIRMTGMPGFDKALSTTQMWQVSLLLANFDKAPATVKVSLIPPPPVPPAAPDVPGSPAAKKKK